jgi:hypothetical protein
MNNQQHIGFMIILGAIAFTSLASYPLLRKNRFGNICLSIGVIAMLGVAALALLRMNASEKPSYRATALLKIYAGEPMTMAEYNSLMSTDISRREANIRGAANEIGTNADNAYLRVTFETEFVVVPRAKTNVNVASTR